ncbi:DMT family transporter [Aaestuariibius violaceus]|uniref:DMT family transporter n=1 Tax=Aestuariibius violaceus TaxID=3234132 RepID=UPI00398E566B
MSLNIWALAIVKASGAEFPATQLVFLRAAVGLVLMIPWIVTARADFRLARRPGLHLARIALSSLTLTASFYAIARVPFALFTAVNFTRPLVMIALAALFLAEPATPRRWLAALLGLVGVLIAVGPGPASLDPAFLALTLTVLSGTAAIIVTCKINDQPPVVLMTAYTAGLAVTTAVPAALSWAPVARADWPVLLAIGLFAQAAQFCFLRAHRGASAGLLGIVGYVSLVLSTCVGWLLFDEVPSLEFWCGTLLILTATWIVRASWRGSVR